MKHPDQRTLKQVAWIGLSMMLLLGVISNISDSFEYGQTDDKPILAIVTMLMIATALSVWAVRTSLQVVDRQRQLFWLILSLAIGFRAVMLFTPPIMEVDYYRYLWDGKVVQTGVSPYRYAPQIVLDASGAQLAHASQDQDLETLVALTRSSSAHEILTRVHYPKLTTLYPPISQWVFCCMASVVPTESSVWVHVLIIRAAFVLFDLGTILLLAIMLKRLDRHLGWLIAYAWNPLVIKEIANSGHLDSLAVFLMLSAAFFLLKVRSDGSRSHALISGVALGLAVGAKLFPVVLVPAFLARLGRYGWRMAAGFGFAFFITCGFVLYPMSNSYPTWSDSAEKQSPQLSQTTALEQDGLTNFLSKWRMNDAIFSAIYYNLKPDRDSSDDSQNNWYVVTPSKFRDQVAKLQNHVFFGSNPAYTLTRLFTLSIFGIIYLVMLGDLRSGDEQIFLRAILFVLFSFLMLQPTVNPWYWVWAIPFTCFSSRWSWSAISGVLLLYYTRFYFQESSLEFTWWQQSYAGVEIFDHFVVWIELILIVIFVAFAGRLDKA